jgi:membrane fusion protein, heavy metal efflux system
MRLHSSLLSCVIAGTLSTAVALPGCSAPATATTQTERDLPDDLPDGMVRVPEASRQFVVVEAAGPVTEDGALRVPARVEFKDGAVSQVGAPLDGRVVHVHVSTGDTVRAGSPLVTLDCPEAASVRAAVDTANASLLEARASLDRERRMFEEGIGIEREKLAAETKVTELEAELARAEASTSFVGPGAGTAVMLRAPIAGTIITRKATEGMAVQRGTEPLVEIGDPSSLWVVADVFERDLPLVRQGATARVELPSLQQTLAGNVVSVGAVVSSGLRTAPVRISLSLHTTPLRPGMYGRADIAVGHDASSLTLPTEAVLVKGKDTVVYVEKSPTTFERRAVVVGQPLNGRVQVVSGLAPGDRVVVRGALLLDGAADQLL